MKSNPYIKIAGYALVGLVCLAFSFSGIAQSVDQATLTYPNAEKDLSTAKATVHAYENGKWEELRSYLREDAIIYGLGNFDSLTVDETISYWSEGREKAKPELGDGGTWLGVSIKEGPRAGNWIYHWGTNTIRYESGEEITFPYHVALKLKDNKVTESHFYYDNMKIIRGMGYAISPPLQETEEEVPILEFGEERSKLSIDKN